MKREFLPITNYPEYNNEVDRLMVNSKILNSSNELPNTNMMFWDDASIRFYLLQLVGDSEGYYVRHGERQIAKKPYVQMRLDMLKEQFEQYKKQKVNSGYEMPTNMPPEMLNMYYLLKARLAVLCEEEADLRKRLKVIEDREKVEDNSKVLQYGLQCAGKNHGTRATDPNLVDVLAVIDGQKCELTDGQLRIVDSRSPFNNVLVSQYRQLAKVWQEQRQAEELEKFKILQQSYREQNLPVPQQPPISAPKPVSMESLREFAKKHLAHDTVSK